MAQAWLVNEMIERCLQIRRCHWLIHLARSRHCDQMVGDLSHGQDKQCQLNLDRTQERIQAHDQFGQLQVSA